MDYVLITGATSGIGYALAEIFYQKGHSLILVGRSLEKLRQTKVQLTKREGMDINEIDLKRKERETSQEIILICQDLSQQEAAQKVYTQVKSQGLKVQILINNAGAGYVGAFVEEDERMILEHMVLNMTSLTLLTRYFAEEMKKLGEGKILNVASTGAYHPGSYTAVYYATKAYVLSLSEALYAELKPVGIHVASLCPGATKTNFAKAAGRADASIAMSAEEVAAKAYKGLMKNKRVIIPGIKNWLWIKAPRKIAMPFIEKYQKNLMHKNVK